MKHFLFSVVLVFVCLIGFGQTDSSSVQQTKETDNDTTETMPEFPGGLSAFSVYIHNSILYPQIEKESGKEGIVYVQFIVEKDGSITNVKEVKGVPGAPGLTKEAIRVISTMPAWKPGTKNGKSVRVAITQPVKFVLGEKVPKKKKHK